jgi:hypothetical protein
MLSCENADGLCSVYSAVRTRIPITLAILGFTIGTSADMGRDLQKLGKHNRGCVQIGIINEDRFAVGLRSP